MSMSQQLHKQINDAVSMLENTDGLDAVVIQKFIDTIRNDHIYTNSLCTNCSNAELFADVLRTPKQFEWDFDLPP